MRKLYASGEEYLKWILKIQKKIGAVRSIDLAEYMGFSRPSISIAVKKLEDGEFLTKDANGYLHLTERGRIIAENIYERHQFFTELLASMGVSYSVAEEDACRIEHVISEETFQKIKENVGSSLNLV